MKTSNFLKIKCPKCRHTQVVFGKASTQVKCKSCNALLVRSQGGKAKIKAQITEVL